MAKLLLILFIGLIFESTGVILLKKGMTRVGDLQAVTPGEIVRVVCAGVTNGQVLLGIFFEALFFACLLLLMARSDISVLWPLTALGFVFATFAAILFLHEQVSATRWAGVVLIMIGAALISYSQQTKEPSKPSAPPPSADFRSSSSSSSSS